MVSTPPPEKDVHIALSHVSVYGVDTHARAATLRQWFTQRKALKSTRIPILKDVSPSIRAGERVGILGVNGSGKSSLLKVISGNCPIHAGTREVEGDIGPLIEMGAGFDMELSGRRNIKLSYVYRGKLREYTKEAEGKIIEFAEIGDKIDLPVKNYSSGMLGRIAFASAIMQNPDILLLDEVFAAGDIGFIEKSSKAMMEKVDQAKITIFVNHVTHQILPLCTRFILMHEGRIVTDGEPHAIVHKYHRDILHMDEAQAGTLEATHPQGHAFSYPGGDAHAG